MVGSCCTRQRRCLEPTRLTRPPPSRSDQSHPFQPPGNRGCGWRLAVLTKQTGLNLFGAPLLMALASASDAFDPLTSHPQGHSVRPARTIDQITPPTFCKTLEPLVGSFTTNAESSAQVMTRMFLAEQSSYQLPPLLNN